VTKVNPIRPRCSAIRTKGVPMA